MAKGIPLEELKESARRQGIKLPRELAQPPVDPEEVNRLAAKVIGALAEASSQAARRRALDKARRMLGRR